MPVREGLARLEGVESISETCNRLAGTGELRPRKGRLIDPDALAQQIRDIRVGARLRGLEATVDGTVEQIDGKSHLRSGGSKQPLALAALTHKVQIDALNKKALPLSAIEKSAFADLLGRANGNPERVRVTGPLRNLQNTLTLEVREFTFKR